jgi:hypothetical protein
VKGCRKHFANEVKKGDEKLNFADGFLPGRYNARKKQKVVKTKNKPREDIYEYKNG